MTNKVTDSTYQPRVQWYWKSNNNVKSTDEKEEWIKYSDSESEIIEEAFCGTNKKVWFELNHYWTNLYNFIQINKYDQNKQRQIKRVGINGNEILAASEGSLSPDSRPKSFHESGLEGGIAFIYDWKKRNATLSNSEIVIQAANGILVEINQSDIVCIRKEKLKWLIDVLLSIKDASETDILKFCICMYTQVEYLFQLMNETLRENDKTKIDTLAPYCYFLTEAIWSNALNPERYKSTVYRGVCLDPDLIRHYKDAIGTYKCWYGFSSASKTPEVASIFGDNVLFIIDVSCAGALDISSYSVIPDEQEVILPPGTTFRIDNVEHSDSKTYIYIFVVPEIRMVLLGRTGTGKNIDNLVLR
jgi:hypothetical protein